MFTGITCLHECVCVLKEKERYIRWSIHEVLERREDREELPRNNLEIAVSQIVHEIDKSDISNE